jgi:hypothetical protein
MRYFGAVVMRCGCAGLQSAAARVLFSSLSVSLISNSDSMILHDFIFTLIFLFFLSNRVTKSCSRVDPRNTIIIGLTREY